MSRIQRLRPLAGLLALGFAAPAFAQSVQFPTYWTGPQPDGSYVVSDGHVITPAGRQVFLGERVRAKAIAINPNSATHTAVVLTLGAAEPVIVFNTLTGEVLQNYLPFDDSSGSYSGITYSADGKYLMFSQDSSNVTVATVAANGFLTDFAHVAVPPNTSFIKCFPNSPPTNSAPCGTLYENSSTSYPGGVAFSADGKSAYALLNQNNTLATIDLTRSPPKFTKQIRVGNAPHSILLHNNFAYISNEGGRAAKETDFQISSEGTPIVADKLYGFSTTGTLSVVDLATMKVAANISVGLHPTGMAMVGDGSIDNGQFLLVTNAQSDSISVIDTATNKVARTINLGLPISVPGQTSPAFGATPNSIAYDTLTGVAYVALYNANAIAVVNLNATATKPVTGLIPVAYAPASVVLDKVNRQLIVANDKGVGTLASFETDFGVTGFNSHQDTGTVSIVKIPTASRLKAMTKQVYQNNHWDLTANIEAAGGANPKAAPVAIPAHIGEPSLIKHVFVIVRENRTYDQMLGDVAKGNGDPTLAVFGKTYSPNMHEIVNRFPLLDNFYTPSRQSADGHNWMLQSMAPYQDDIQAPDWVRSYPGGSGGDALAYTTKGFLFNQAQRAGLSVKLFGENVENETFPTALGHPSWSEFYNDSIQFDATYAVDPSKAKLKYENAILSTATVPSWSASIVPNFPPFDLNIPDQWRVDLWLQDFNKDVAAGTLPALSIMWIMDDHTGGPPSALAEQADNDLAVGRIIDYISHSSAWKDSAIFIEEDDSQNGVDHIDGHRSPGYVISPYAVQTGMVDHTYYTQVNMERTIEQILGLPPMTQYDLVASPMLTAFTDKPNFAPFSHVPANIELDSGVQASAEPASELEMAWRGTKAKMFAGKTTKPDAEDPYTLNHLIWYEATAFKRPYPGETKVRPPSEFADRLAQPIRDLDD